MVGRRVSDQKNGKWVLDMIGDLKMLVHVNCTQFSFGWLVRGEVTTDRLGSD